MNKITALNVFRRVVEMGTFRAAADDLHLSQAAVSKNINELEAYLGIALINRTTRRLSVTEAGMTYYRQICAVLDGLEAADQSIMATSFTPRGRLRIGMPMSYGLIRLNPLVCEFQRRYPAIGIEVILSDAYMDLVDQGLDVVIRGAGTLEDSTLRAKPLCQVQRVLCAAPDYLKEAGQPAQPEDLKEHNCLRYSLSSSPDKWCFSRVEESLTVNVRPASFCANNGIALKQAAVQGLGVILVPKEFVASELADGTLVTLLPDWQPNPHALFAVYPFHKEQSPNVRLFIEFIVKAFQPR
ncbi:LysR family transcriptional regulator [Aeromonas hydrophila]|uniref:LysR family transcriptional regulator n=1 Tax=Aeromonas hydrophila TaxID=644 RepID=UPI000332B27F|nr:LysR family transcriptional regulator [Aeromonas hydrophila]AGM42007.1 Transcriptional regulator [Aeromonas hydrophila ML09-119]AHX30744.1 transcriptional regulator [Aeromonas hydrophila subsp. hydrophila AL09-71]AHX67540.1 transcriptional regulator [Aeromonas hydrophila pc104A]AJE38404.1 transcriptional regulator [Aeromonas hydrophila J-1]AKJ36700.1 transcriptional regulator [Aeromonas hydrophila NJ-35]